MKIVVQRVKSAEVRVEEELTAEIGKGFLLLVGVEKGDSVQTSAEMARKISALRIFDDSFGKMNLDIRQVSGEILSVPQFTLLANIGKGNRPGFDNAALPENAKNLWQKFDQKLIENGIKVFEGIFASHMHVSLVNDGPVTFVIDSREILT
ncbi:MAG: D-aminoacyl-tRNA deacylase [Candidatus Omnitrophota bacterium]|nr:D-tyrosyl-tRNA(Tyr) deacylase [Candidatus Omnitrophota bacterium]